MYLIGNQVHALKSRLLVSKTSVIRHGQVWREGIFKEESLWFRDGKIIAAETHADEEIDAEGSYVTPGFIDLQVNGAFGVDVTSQPEKLGEISLQLPKFGVTSFLATVVTSSEVHYKHVLPILNNALSNLQGAKCLGIHLEGPFLSPDYTGAHAFNHLLQPSQGLTSLEDCYGSLDGVRMLTLAPELDGAYEAISALKKKGIATFGGHTNATYKECLKAFENGLSGFTHLFNAMRPLHHREPGPVGATLDSKEAFYSLIADGVHLHPAIVRMAYKSHPQGCFLISDSTAPLGAKPGSYPFGDQRLISNGKDIRLDQASQALAGSACSLFQALLNFMKYTSCPFGEAVKTVTMNPAKVLGIDKQKGTLAEGADADILIISSDFKIRYVYSL